MFTFKKEILITFCIVTLISSCSEVSEADINDHISGFYEKLEVENYEPISFSKLDTTLYPTYTDMTKGTIIHEYYAKANNGSIKKYKTKFEVTISNGEVVALPEGGKY